MLKPLKECLRGAMDQNGMIQTMKVGQNARFDFSHQEIRNNNTQYCEMDLYVYFNGHVPMRTYLDMAKLPGFHDFDQNLPTLESGPAGNLQMKAIVWVKPSRIQEFTQAVHQMPGFIGVELSAYCDAAEYEQFERYCTPKPVVL